MMSAEIVNEDLTMMDELWTGLCFLQDTGVTTFATKLLTPSFQKGTMWNAL